MHELYRMLGREQEVELQREAAKIERAAGVRHERGWFRRKRVAGLPGALIEPLRRTRFTHETREESG